MRFIAFASAFMAIASVILLYAVNYDTRLIEARVRTGERDLARARAEIAVLRAERAYLGRPDRIAPLARALGLRPADAAQFAIPDFGADGKAAVPRANATRPR